MASDEMKISENVEVALGPSDEAIQQMRAQQERINALEAKIREQAARDYALARVMQNPLDQELDKNGYRRQ